MCRGHPKLINIINKPSESVETCILTFKIGGGLIIDHHLTCHFSVIDKNDRGVVLLQPYSPPTRFEISPMIVLKGWPCLGVTDATLALYIM